MALWDLVILSMQAIIAIDTFQDKFKERGAEIVLETLKVDLSPEDEDIRNCQEFAASFATEVNKERSI